MARTAGSEPVVEKAATEHLEEDGIRAMASVDTGLTGPLDPEEVIPSEEELRALMPDVRELRALGSGFNDDEQYIVNVEGKRVHRKNGLTENCNTDQIKVKAILSGKQLNESNEAADFDACDWCQ